MPAPVQVPSLKPPSPPLELEPPFEPPEGGEDCAGGDTDAGVVEDGGGAWGCLFC